MYKSVYSIVLHVMKVTTTRVPPVNVVVMQCSQSSVVLLSLLHCRKYKVRRWFSQIKDAFKNVSNMPDYGLSIAWPEPPTEPKVCEGMGMEGVVWKKARCIGHWRSQVRTLTSFDFVSHFCPLLSPPLSPPLLSLPLSPLFPSPSLPSLLAARL